MISDPVQKLMQCLPAGFDEVIVETFHHPFHDKLFWQRLRPKIKTITI